MRVSYNWLQTFFEKKLPTPEKLADLLMMHTAEVEAVERVKEDTVFELDVLPNRAGDLLSHEGMAREVAALTNTKYQNQNVKSNPKSKFQIKDFLKVGVEDPQLCPRYTAGVMLGVKVGPSPTWLKERLEAVGARSINNVVDATNYVMMELGQPLHAFDFDKLTHTNQRESEHKSTRIIVRRAKEGEAITTLDGEKRNLDTNVLVIADSEKPIAIAGIMGGEDTEVSRNTRNVILESAFFDGEGIRKTAKLLGLSTESSLRFSGGIDEALPPRALDRAASLIQELAGGTIVSAKLDVYPKQNKQPKIILELSYVHSLLGVSVSSHEIAAILTRLECKVKILSTKRLLVTPPSFRRDLGIREDLIEEIGRVRGYETIEAALPHLRITPPHEDPLREWQDTVKNVLAGMGYTETHNYSLIEGRGEKNVFRLANPLSSEFETLRSSLLFSLLNNIRKNAPFFEDIRLFEIGEIYDESRAPVERMHLGIAVAKKTTGGDEPAFYECKAAISRVLEALGIYEVSFRPIETKAVKRTPLFKNLFHLWHPSRSACIIAGGGDVVGYVGDLHPDERQKSFGDTGEVSGAELDFERLVELGSRDTQYRSISRYPALIRDVAVLTDKTTHVEDVLNVIEASGGTLIRDVDLFDLYEGEELPGEKKNIAFHLVYQADDHTLSEREVDVVHGRIERALEEMGWEVR